MRELVMLRGVMMVHVLMKTTVKQTKNKFGRQMVEKQMRTKFELMTKRGGKQEKKMAQICQWMQLPVLE